MNDVTNRLTVIIWFLTVFIGTIIGFQIVICNRLGIIIELLEKVIENV